LPLLLAGGCLVTDLVGVEGAEAELEDSLRRMNFDLPFVLSSLMGEREWVWLLASNMFFIWLTKPPPLSGDFLEGDEVAGLLLPDDL